MGRTKGTNPEEEFNNGSKFQISKTSSFQKVTGSQARNAKNNTAYTVTRVSEDGVDERGIIRYKRDVILFDNKEDLKAFNKLDSLKEEGGSIGKGTIIATGSTDPSKKSFELTEAGANISYVKNKYHIKNDKQIPDISRFSPVALALGIRPGQMCKIIRPSRTAINSNFYSFFLF